MASLIVLMLDGISADSFARRRAHMPHLAELAASGLVVERLGAEVCGTSFPGRTSILTGVPAAVSGIYGNAIWDGTAFRHATPDDVRVETLPARAQLAGKDTAVIGFGMVRPEDVRVFEGPWWAGTFLQRSRDINPVASPSGWLRVAQHRSERLVQVLQGGGLERAPLPEAESTDRFTRAAVGDARIMDAAAALATSAHPPEVIFTEVLLPDTAQHYAGYDSALALWSFAYADALVGGLLQRLRAAGLEERYNLALLSDHGHGPIEKALRPEAIIPGAIFQTEGSMLHVVPRDRAEEERVTAALAEHGAIPYPAQHLPADQREQVRSYLAPDGYSFEYDPLQPSAEPVAAPRLRSSHGLRPGHPRDERFMVLAGPDVPRLRLERAAAVQVAPTLAALLGLSLTDFPGEALLEPGWSAARA